jgi:acetyl esterase/lipase
MKTILLTLGLTTLIGSCNKSQDAIPVNESKQLLNISYGSDPKQKLDLYLPANRSTDSTVLAIMIHGGTWTSGDKADINGYITEMKKRLPRYAFANLNYRLANTNQNKFPTQENDIKAATEFLLSKTAEYNISNKFVFVGASAGAHLALLQGYKHSSIVQPKSLISFFGPTDLIDLYQHPAYPATPLLLQTLMNGTIDQNRSLYEQSSPINFVTAQSAPTMLIYGGKDSIVPLSQATLLKQKLASVNVDHELHIYDNAGHGLFGDALKDALDKVSVFLQQHVR